MSFGEIIQTAMKNLSLLLALLCTTFVPVGAQMSTSPVDWSQIELVGREYKMPPPGFRWWYLTPVAVAPPVIYFFTRKEEGPFPLTTCLSGKVAGIFGMGKIGQAIARRAAFVML